MDNQSFWDVDDDVYNDVYNDMYTDVYDTPNVSYAANEKTRRFINGYERPLKGQHKAQHPELYDSNNRPLVCSGEALATKGPGEKEEEEE